jgi:glyoxylase-like metal-dependent hydrolase (beta-lactamase superfamily II)
VSWYRYREVVPGVWLIAEPSHVNTWLVQGKESAVLLDTGMGIEPIRPIAERISTTPVEVVNTHYHFDHTGGNYEFETIAIHELGAPLLAQSWPREILQGYYAYARRLLAAAETYRKLDRQFFHLLTPDSDPLPFPGGFDPSSWVIKPSEATTTLTDGDTIDLGDRSLLVLHTPGHSPDGICLLDERAGLLFGGDTINTGPIYAQFPDSDVEAFGRSARRLAELESEVRFVLVHHFGRGLVESSFLREVADGFDRLLSGETDLTRDRDCIEGPVLRASFERFSIFVPDPAAPTRVLTEREEVGAKGGL